VRRQSYSATISFSQQQRTLLTLRGPHCGVCADGSCYVAGSTLGAGPDLRLCNLGRCLQMPPHSRSSVYFMKKNVPKYVIVIIATGRRVTVQS